MSDVTAGLSVEEMAELCALADGTLSAERRGEVEARVAASPKLRELLERQRRALLATQTLTAEEPPGSLQAAVAARRRALDSRRGARRRLVPRLALTGALALAAATVAAIVLSGGPGAPTVADAARLATQTPTAPAPGRGTTATRLPIEVEGVAFPNLERYGWRALGVRRGHVDSRRATAVFYGKDGRRLGYVIVAGAGLSRPSAQAKYIRRVEYQTLRLNGRLAVSWRRGGHTCVLIGAAARAELLKLASWPLNSPR